MYELVLSLNTVHADVMYEIFVFEIFFYFAFVGLENFQLNRVICLQGEKRNIEKETYQDQIEIFERLEQPLHVIHTLIKHWFCSIGLNF